MMLLTAAVLGCLFGFVIGVEAAKKPDDYDHDDPHCQPDVFVVTTRGYDVEVREGVMVFQRRKDSPPEKSYERISRTLRELDQEQD